MNDSQIKSEEISIEDNQIEFVKCGEIFVADNGRFRWNCLLCGEYFENTFFFEHVLSSHISSFYNPTIEIEKFTENNFNSHSTIISKSNKCKFGSNFKINNVLDKYNIKKNVRIKLERNSFLEHAIKIKQKRKEEIKTQLKLNKKLDGMLTIEENCNVCIESKSTYIKNESDLNHKNSFTENGEISKVFSDVQRNSETDKKQLSFQKCSKHGERSLNSQNAKIINGRKSNKHVCGICSEDSNTKYNLNNHIKLEHNINFHEREKYACDRCKKNFTAKKSLQNHMKTCYLKEKPFIYLQCNIDGCGQGFIDEKSLKKHQAFHRDNKSFACPKCNKKYLRKYSLDYHYKRYHILGKINQCKECGKTFYYKHVLKNHMICHTNEKPFACDECPAKFSREKNLLWHKKIHSGIKDHVCQICGRAYHVFSGLYSHMKRHGITYNMKIEKGLISVEKIVPYSNR